MSRTSTVASLAGTEIEQLQQAWRRDHCIVLPRLFAPTLVDEIRRELRQHGEFAPYLHDASGAERKLARNSLVWMLDFLMNDTELLQAITAITGVAVTWFYGRIFQLTPGTQEAHDWHDDVNETRRLGVSVNLSEGTFEGGELQLRDARSTALVAAVANRGAGDAVLFRLGADLEHRVLPVTGGVPRVAYAGWFHTGPSLRERLPAPLSGRTRTA